MEANEFFKKKKLVKRDCILVRVDLNRGIFFEKHQGLGNHWHRACVNQAIFDYYNRYELQAMSKNNEYFMFFDNFLSEYSVWELQDQTVRLIKKIIKAPYANKS